MYLFIQILTVIRIPLAILFTVTLINNEHTIGILFFCAGLLLLCELTDLFDGILARRHGLTSEFGAMLDPYADSVTRLIVYWGLAAASLAFLVVPLVMAFRDITVAYSRIQMTKGNVTVGARLSGKIKAVVQAVFAFILLFGPLYWPWTGEWTVSAASWIVIIATLASCVEYVIDAVKASKTSL